MEIRDPLSSELLSTLTKPDVFLTGELAYSPDGRSIASLSNYTSLVIWDIQTGGVVKEIVCGDTKNVSWTWSLDGKTICIVDASYAVRVHDVASNTTLFPGALQSRHDPQLWAHSTSFRVMTTGWDSRALAIDISEAGSVLTKIESFRIGSFGQYDKIGSFSPTTYQVSVLACDQIRILDVRNSECLLEREGDQSGSHCFSSDGSLFAIYSFGGVHIWKYTSTGRYTLWREFPSQSWGSIRLCPLQFSPTLSSILGSPASIPQVWHLDGPPIVSHPDSRTPLAVLSSCGAYIATCDMWNNIVTITNLHSQTPPQFIDTGMEIDELALTGNVLLVKDSSGLVAWRLTEEGVVDSGVFDNRTAGCGNSIWTVLIHNPTFLVGNQTVTIKRGGGNAILHAYHTRSGEVLEPAQAPPHPFGRYYSPRDMRYGQHYIHYRKLDEWGILSEDGWPVSQDTFQEGWVKDREGKHRLWIPIEWRTYLPRSGWLSNITTLWLNREGGAIIIMF